MEFVAALLFAFALGFLLRGLVTNKPAQEFRLIMAIQLSSTEPTKITAVGKDAEGNNVDLTGSDLTIEAVAFSGNLGEVNDANDTFNPGDAGATGTIKGSVTINGKVYTDEVEVELVAGGLSSIELAFSPADA